MGHWIYPTGFGGTTCPPTYVHTNADFTLLWQQLFGSLNGDGGGAWAPAAPIDIGGLGLRARLRYDLYSVHPDADTIFQITSTRVIEVDNTLTANRNATLSNTGALKGDQLVVVKRDSATKYATVKDNAGNALLTVGKGGNARAALFEFNGTAWEVLLASYGNQIIQFTQATLAGSFSTSSTSFVDVTGFTTDSPGAAFAPLTALAGDFIEVVAAVSASGTNGEIARISMVVKDGASDHTVQTQDCGLVTGVLAMPASFAAIYGPVVNSGAVSVRAQIRSVGGTSVSVLQANSTSNIVARILRTA